MLSSVPPHLISFIVAVALLALIIYPLTIHLTTGWHHKSNEILQVISNRSAQLYFEAFQNTQVKLDEAKKTLETFYLRGYGRRFLIFPTGGTVFVGALSVYMLGESGELALRRFSGASPDPKDYFAVPFIASAGIAGAYAFVT